MQFFANLDFYEISDTEEPVNMYLSTYIQWKYSR